jgi:quinone-modifying oxidoreductase subunit QmoC
MAIALEIQPDTSFIRALGDSAGGDLKKCMQCGVCSAVCELSPEEAPFPRRLMLDAQWGLKDRLLTDPALWLCQKCGQCTTDCPRGARPGDVLDALRREAVKYFAFPKFLGKIVAAPAGLLSLLTVPVLLFLAVAYWVPKGQPSPNLEFANVFPIPVLEAIFFCLAGFVLIAFAVGLARFIRALHEQGVGPVLPGLIPALKDALFAKKLAACSGRLAWRWGHSLTLWAFGGLALVGTGVGIGTMLGIMRTPLSLASPFKILANLGALVIFAGTGLLLLERLVSPAKRTASTWFDWFFLTTLFGVALTGILSEVLRLAHAATIMYPVYFVHLVLIFTLFLCAPYSKFAHLAYRTVAMASTWGRGSKQAAKPGFGMAEHSPEGA